MPTYFAQRAILGEVRRFAAQFARASVRVDALAVVLRTRAREMAASQTHEARRKGQGVVRLHRFATPREVVFLRAAPVADANRSRSSPDFRFNAVAAVLGPCDGRTVLGRVSDLATCEARRVRVSFRYAFQPSRLGRCGSVRKSC